MEKGLFTGVEIVKLQQLLFSFFLQIYVWKVYLETFALDFKQESVIIEDMIMSKQVEVQPYCEYMNS